MIVTTSIFSAKNVKLIDEDVKERLRSVSLVITSLLTSLHDTAMDGLNKGFKVASDKFEKIINSSERIFDNTNTILEILLEGHQNIIFMVGAGTMSVLVVLVLAQTGYMMKLTREIKKKESEADKKTEEMQKNWNKLEDTINKLTQEVISLQDTLRGGLRAPVQMITPAGYLPGPGEECMDSYPWGHPNMSSVCGGHPTMPYQGSNTLSLQ